MLLKTASNPLEVRWTDDGWPLAFVQCPGARQEEVRVVARRFRARRRAQRRVAKGPPLSLEKRMKMFPK